MTKISGNTPHIPQTDTPQAPVEKTGVAAPQSGQAPVLKDEVGDIPGAPTAQHQVDLPPEEAISSLKSLAQNMNTNDHGNISSRGDVDIAVDPNANFDMNSLPGTLNASAGMIEQNPALVSATLNSVNSSLQQSQQASYGQVFQQGTYQPGTVFSGGTTVGDSFSGSGSSMSLNASAQRTMENLCSDGLPTDPMAFVQFVLRESYLETTNVLMDHANKVRFFNDVKKEIRAKAQQLRDVLSQHAGAGDTDVIGNTQTEDINQSFHGQTTTNSTTTYSAPQNTGLTQEEIKAADDAYDQELANNVVQESWTHDKYSKRIHYGDSDEYKKFDEHGATTGEDAAKTHAASMTPKQEAALMEHYRTNGFHVDLECQDTDKKDNTYSSDKNEKTYPRAGESLENFIERAIEEQSGAFKTEVEGQEGNINIESLTTTIRWPTVELSEDKKTPAELAAAHRDSPKAQAAAGSAIRSQSYSSSDVSLGQNVTTKAEHENALEKYEQQLNSVGDDAQLANVDLQNWLQKQQQTMQMMSNISKLLHDTAMAIIRKIG